MYVSSQGVIGCQCHCSHSAFSTSHWLERFSNFNRQSAQSGILLPYMNSFLLQGHFHLTSLPSIWIWNIQVFWIIKTYNSLPCLRKIIFIFHGVFHFIISYLCDDPLEFLIRISSEFIFIPAHTQNFNQEISL